MKVDMLSNAAITLHWNLSKERITLGGALTLRAECEMISEHNGQRAFNILISPGANSVQDIKYIYEAVFESCILVFSEIKTAESDTLYPDSCLTAEKNLLSFSTERIAILFSVLEVTPKLEWSEKINSEVDKILGTLSGRFICLSLKFSGLRVEDGDAELGDVVEDRSAESPFEVAATALLPEEIQRLLAPLDEREREILKLRFGLDRGEPRTLEEVGDHFNLTRERIRQIEARAMSKLRHPSSDTGARDLLAV